MFRLNAEETIFVPIRVNKYFDGNLLNDDELINTVKAKIKKISIVPHRYLIINLFKKKDIVQLEKIKNLSMVPIIFFSNRQNNRLSNGKFIRL